MALVAVLAAVLAAISVAVFFTVQRALYDQLDESLTQRATAAATSDLADPTLLRQVSSDVLAAGDFRVAILYANGQGITLRENAPPLGSDEQAVAAGRTDLSVRTGFTDEGPYRTVAVSAGSDVVVHARVADGADVITWFDLHTSIASPAPTANWSHVEDGRITAIRVTFDAREITAAG